MKCSAKKPQLPVSSLKESAGVGVG